MAIKSALDEEILDCTEEGQHWACNFVARANELGLTIDVSDLNRPALRHEVIRLVFEVYGITPEEAAESVFSDLDPGHSAFNYIMQAYSDGWIAGDAGLGTVRPDATVNRAEVTKIIQAAQDAYAAQ